MQFLKPESVIRQSITWAVGLRVGFGGVESCGWEERYNMPMSPSLSFSDVLGNCRIFKNRSARYDFFLDHENAGCW